MRNNYYLLAGILCVIVAFIHVIGGQLSLVNPLLGSQLKPNVITEWLGAWHMITVMLFVFGYILIRFGLNTVQEHYSLVNVIMLLCFLFSFCFIGASIIQGQHAPQYSLFLSIAFLCYLGRTKINISID